MTGSDSVSNKFIPLSVPSLKGKELEYITSAVETEWVSTAGPFINEFESSIADYVISEGAVACQNGTSGLHIALKVCDVSEGDEVIAPNLTFIAAVNPIKYLGAEPILFDCDESLSLDVNLVRSFCEHQCVFQDGKLINQATKKRVKAIVVVHVFGNMADMEGIMDIAKTYQLKVIEDATEAIGTFYRQGIYRDKYAGTIGDVGVYSFNGNKIMTTGGGGMIVSNQETILKRAKHLTTQAKSDELYYTHDEIGYNYRMTNLQAALGLAQLEQLEKFIQVKSENYAFYKNELEKIPGLRILDFKSDIRPNYWFYALFIDNTYPLNRDQLIKYLAAQGIQSRPIWGLISDQKPYQNCQTYLNGTAKHYHEHVINIPCSSSLSREDATYVVDRLKQPIINLIF